MTVMVEPPSPEVFRLAAMGGGISSNDAIDRMGLTGVPLAPPVSLDAIFFVGPCAFSFVLRHTNGWHQMMRPGLEPPAT